MGDKVIKSSDCWARLDKDKGSLDTILNIFYEKNPINTSRHIKVRIFSEEHGVEKNFTLVQQANGVIVFKNKRVSAQFRKEGCNPETEQGQMVEYVVPAGRYTSTVSQTDADRQAQEDIEANGQNYANTVGECETVLWFSSEQSRTFKKNDCNPDTEEGSDVVYTVPAGKYTSNVSQEDADSKALAEIEQEGQNYANENGECVTVKWYNVEKSKAFKRNNCEDGKEGTIVTYTVEAGTYSSSISQQDADDKAQADVDANGQNYANENGECKTSLWYNTEVSQSFKKNDCDPETEEGETVEYVVPAGKYSSEISQEDADRQAQEDIAANGQNYANENGTCNTVLWYNSEQSKSFTKNDCNPDTEAGTEVIYTVPERTYSSTISQEDADGKATEDIEANGQNYANTNGECTTVKWYNKEKSQAFVKNDCLVTEQGSSVTYTVPAGKYSSDISQEDADAKAQADIDKNGQDYANENGTCGDIIWYNEEQRQTFTKNDCPEGQIGEEYEYIVEAGKYSSDISQDDANQKALDDIAANGQNQANLNAECTPDPNYFIGVASREFTKNDCQEHYHGSVVTVTQDDVTGGPFISRTSQSEANALAMAAVDEQGQGIANERGECIEDEKWTGVYSETFTKNNCTEGGVGSEVIIDQDDVSGGPFVSYESQEAANSLAEAAVKEQGQALANSQGNCTWTGTYSEQFKKNDCEEGETGSTVTVNETQVLGYPFTSNISQEDANNKAMEAVKAQGQTIANSTGSCDDVVYYVGEYSQEFTPNCEECHTGTPLLVTQNDVGGPFTSTVSQEDANRLAREAVEAGGQSYADKNGVCVPDSTDPVWTDVEPAEYRCEEGVSQKKQKDTNECSASYNEERWVEGGDQVCSWTGVYSEVFKRNDCEIPDSGTEVEVTQDDVEGAPFISFVSQDDANSLAEAAVKAQGQAIANAEGSCQFVGVYSKEFAKDNCGSCQHGVSMSVNQDMVGGPFYSLISQEDANNKAKEAVESQGQAYANKNGSCELDDTTPRWEDVVPEELRCNEGKSEKKQQDMNPCSGTYGEFQWVEGGDKDCTWKGVYSKEFTAQCSDGGVGSKVTITQDDVTGGPFTSIVSQEDANAKAQAAVEAQGQALANSRGTCTWTGTYSKSFTKNDCGTCKTGSSVNVNQDMVGGPFTSTVSKADANAKAQAAVEEQGQAVANKNGSCVPKDSTPSWTDTGSTQCSGCTSQKQQRDTNPCSDTYNNTRWTNGGSRDCSENGSWGSWDYYCSGCDQWRRRSNTCGAEEDELYESDASDCGSWDSCSFSHCSGTTGIYTQTNSCSGSSRECDRVPNDSRCCGSYSGTGRYNCVGGVSYEIGEDNCGNTNNRWKRGGSACTATVSCSDLNESGKEGQCSYEKTCSGTQTGSGSTTSEAEDAAYAKCSCSKTYSHTVSSTSNVCGSKCPNGGSSNGKTYSATGTGSSCSAAKNSAWSKWDAEVGGSNWQSYCKCNESKKWNASASTDGDPCNGLGGSTQLVNVRYKVTYNNECSSSKSITVTARCGMRGVSNSISVSIPTGSGTKTGSILLDSGCACGSVIVTGSGSGTC